MSFSKEKSTLLKVIMALLIIADHLGLFYGIQVFKPFVYLGPIIVSIFFFISGYGLMISYCKKGNEYLKSFFSHRFYYVLIPFLLASVAYLLLLCFPENSHDDVLILTYIKGFPLLPFSWFVLVLLYLYAAFYLSFRVFNGKWKVICLIVAVGLYLLFTIFAHFASGWWISTLGFLAGVFYALFEKRLYCWFKKIKVAYWLLISALFVTVILIHCYGNDYMKIISYTCIPLIVVLLVAKLPLDSLNLKIVTTLSVISYEIYLCQGIAMELLRGRLYVHNDAMFTLLVYVITIALAWGVHEISRIIKNYSCTSSTT